MILTGVLSFTTTKFQTNEKLKVSNRMFTKTYHQIIGHGENTIEYKKKQEPVKYKFIDDKDT